MAGVSGSRRVARARARHQVQDTARAAIALKAVGYVRVSTEEQARTGHGLDRQKMSIRAFAESQGYELVDVIEDAGLSGAIRPADRPGFARVLELAERSAFAVLLVHKFDRLARQIAYAVVTTNDLAAQRGVMLRSVTEPIDTATPAGKMMFAVLAAMAEAERDVITERTKGGRMTKAAKGGFACGRAPYGYERDLEGGLRVVPAEAAVVRRIYAWRRRHRGEPRKSFRWIADTLNREGVPPPKGKKWWPGTVGYIADNVKYAGSVEYLFITGGTDTHVLVDGAHAAILA